jgi:hypothetical protein
MSAKNGRTASAGAPIIVEDWLAAQVNDEWLMAQIDFLRARQRMEEVGQLPRTSGRLIQPEVQPRVPLPRPSRDQPGAPKT